MKTVAATLDPSLLTSEWLRIFPKAFILPKKTAQSIPAAFRQAIKMDPANYQAHYMLGQVLIQAGKEDEGRKVLEESRKLRAPGGR